MSHLPFNSMRLAMSGQIFRISIFITLTFSTFNLFAQNVGINTLEPKAGLHVVSNDGILATGELGQGIVQDSGTGTRMMWIPYLGAFRVGGLNGEATDEEFFAHRWDPDSIGIYSFGGGLNSRASGRFSLAFGNRNIASGDFSTAIGGFENIASGQYSFAAGYGNRAPSAYETVIGSFAKLYTPNDPNNFDGNDRVFSIGNGLDQNNRHNVLTILKKGNVGINTASPLYALHVYGVSAIDSGRLTFINTGSSVFIGQDAGKMDDHTDNRNVLIGNTSGQQIVNGYQNIGIGSEALYHNVNDADNIAIGNTSLYTMTNGSENVALGTNTLLNASAGWGNTAIGSFSMEGSSTGHHNTALGHFALFDNGSGYNNVALGAAALFSNHDQTGNVAVGQDAGHENNNSYNTFLGFESGSDNNGHHNVFIGNQSGQNDTTSNKLIIDNSNTSTPLIYGDFANNKVIINDSLTSKYFQMTNGAGENKLLQSNAAGHGTWVDPSSLFSDDWNASGNNIYNNNSQNVGIGTSSPAEKVDVVGNINIQDGRITFQNAQHSTYVGFQAGFSDSNGNINTSTFIGYQSGKATTTGSENTGLGAYSLLNNLTGHNNVALGNAAMNSNLSGYANVALGYGALTGGTSSYSNASVGFYTGNHWNGHENTGIGVQAGENNSAGNGNTFLGAFTGKSSTGSNNVFIGLSAGENETGSSKLYIHNSNTTTPLIYGDFSIKKLTVNDSLSTKQIELNGGRLSYANTGQSVFVGNKAGLYDDHSANVNVFIGEQAGKTNTTGENDIAIGAFAMDGSSSASNNIAIGKDALGSASLSGGSNLAMGNFSLAVNTSGGDNIALGQNTLGANTLAIKNVSMGNYSMDANTTGSYNTAIGHEALGTSVSGEVNVAIGINAGYSSTGNNNTFIGGTSGYFNTGDGNVFLGHEAGFNETGSNKLYIDNSSSGTPLIYGDFSTNEVTINDSLTVNKELSVGTSIANSTFEVNGSVAAKFQTPLVAGTTNPDATGLVWRYSSGTGTITLPTASTCTNRMYVIINQTGTTRNISGYRDLVTNVQTTLGSSQALWIMSDGSQWWQIK